MLNNNLVNNLPTFQIHQMNYNFIQPNMQYSPHANTDMAYAPQYMPTPVPQNNSLIENVSRSRSMPKNGIVNANRMERHISLPPISSLMSTIYNTNVDNFHMQQPLPYEKKQQVDHNNLDTLMIQAKVLMNNDASNVKADVTSRNIQPSNQPVNPVVTGSLLPTSSRSSSLQDVKPIINKNSSKVPVSYTHLDVYKRQIFHRLVRIIEVY